MRAAVVQLNSTAAVARNLEVAESLVGQAADRGAELVVLPEKWNRLAAGEDLAAAAEPLDGRSVSAAREWARRFRVGLLAGSMVERRDGERPANCSLLIDRDGAIVAAYRKIHMFDVEAGGVCYRESAHEAGGDRAVLAEFDGVEVGLSICYDLRFAELYAALAAAGARILTVPAAFTAATGRDHWEVLLRARAIETQCFVLAADQTGKAAPAYDSWGRSMIVDPWGVVLACVGDGEGIALAELDLGRQESIRQRMPLLRHRRPDAYSVATDPATARSAR